MPTLLLPEQIQFIIAEEQARVIGYVTAHENIVACRMDELRAAGGKIGDAYRAVEQEAGWSDVKRQVEAYLAEFEEYCRSLVSTFKPGSGDVLGMGVDLAAAAAAGNGGPVATGMELE